MSHTDQIFERAVDAAFEALGGVSPAFRAEVADALRAADAVYSAADKEFVDGQVAQAEILGWNMSAGVTDLQVTMAMETAAGLVAAAKTFLTATGAENYVEQHVHDRETGERYTLTVQRPGKKTPHDLRRGAEAESDALREDLAVIKEKYERAALLIRDLIDSEGCWFDHHGGCQAHGYLSLEPGERCPQARAKDLLDGTP